MYALVRVLILRAARRPGQGRILSACPKRVMRLVAGRSPNLKTTTTAVTE
jgi:hypothetical protein